MNDARYDDIIERRWAIGADAEDMGRGCRFDYQTQQWLDGHDHAHCSTADESLPLLYCGAAIGSCVTAQAIMAELAR